MVSGGGGGGGGSDHTAMVMSESESESEWEVVMAVDECTLQLCQKHHCTVQHPKVDATEQHIRGENAPDSRLVPALCV